MLQLREGCGTAAAQAAWPNAAFDLCGICCGHFQMPFWQFFGATFIGKALVKVSSPLSVMTRSQQQQDHLLRL